MTVLQTWYTPGSRKIPGAHTHSCTVWRQTQTAFLSVSQGCILASVVCTLFAVALTILRADCRSSGNPNLLYRLNISQSDASIVPRCCRLGQCEWPGIGCWGLTGRPSGGRRAILNMFNISRRRRSIGRRTCTTQLRIVINKTPSPYQPTRMYALRAIRPM